MKRATEVQATHDAQTVEERRARGRAKRAEVPRSSQGEFTPTANRPDPINLLERQAESRIAELVPIRYGRMLVSPFAFFRGAAAVMASDLAAVRVTGLRSQLCGDAHAANFGVFGSPDRRLVFDVNDFDETLPGPWEWDVKRLSASLAVAGRENGFSAKERHRVVLDAAAGYRSAMRAFAAMRDLEVWYARTEVESLLEELRPALTRQRQKRLASDVAKARARDNLRVFSKLTHEVDGQPRIVSDPPLIVPAEELAPTAEATERARLVHDFLGGYRASLSPDRRVLLGRYRFVHLAHKVVGVGSVGTQAWIALLLGRDRQDPLFLQVKEAQLSVLEEHLGKSAYSNHGARVVAGQRLMQASSDIMLGWRRIKTSEQTVDFYARQLKDWKGSAELEAMRPAEMAVYGRTCGWTLARGHARSGDRIAIAGYLGRGPAFDRAMADFAEAYADQNDRDYAALKEAVKAGRVNAETGV
jgi:uncharacterized protein (DUF2252 family)